MRSKALIAEKSVPLQLKARIIRLASLSAVILLFVLGALGVNASKAQNSPAQVQSYFNQLNQLEADFTQLVIDDKNNIVEQSSGRLKLAKPGKAHWDYLTPYRQQLVTNGQTVWLYDMDLEQVTVRPISDFAGQLPTSLLTGQKPIASEFTVRRVGQLGDNIQRWSLTPKSNNADFKNMLLGFSGGKLVKIEVTNLQDQLTLIDLKNVNDNAFIPNQTFDFNVPAGVDVFQ